MPPTGRCCAGSTGARRRSSASPPRCGWSPGWTTIPCCTVDLPGLGGLLRPAAPLGPGLGRGRGLGRLAGGGGAARGGRSGAPGAGQPPWRGRAHGDNGRPVGPGAGRRGPADGRPGLLGSQPGAGATAWFGQDTREAVDRLVWLRDVAAPVLEAALAATGPVALLPIMVQGLQMGDDVHMRTQAATNLFLRHLLRGSSPSTGQAWRRWRASSPATICSSSTWRWPRPRWSPGRPPPSRARAWSSAWPATAPPSGSGSRAPATPGSSPRPRRSGGRSTTRASVPSRAPRHRRQRGAGAGRARRPGGRGVPGGGRLPGRHDGRRGGDHRGHGPHLRRPEQPLHPAPARLPGRRWGSTPAGWWSWSWPRRSTPASSMPAPAPGRSAPGSPRRRSTASARRSWRWTGVG